MKDNNSIFINQVGYSLKDSKYAFLMGDFHEGTDLFEVFDVKTNACVYSGKVSLSQKDDARAGQPIYLADFSELENPGQYYVQSKDAKSFNFKIEKNVYKDLYFKTLNYFNLSRCGQGICHTGEAEIYGTNQTKNVQGGWHDAGDYGRYIVAGAKTVMDLLIAYKNTRDSFTDFDILSEVRFELEWMLQMQRDDGAVYHKISCYHFCAFIMPEEEKDKLVLSPVSTAATADFAGVMAYSSAFFEDIDPNFARNLLAAAKKAQLYLDSHEDEFFINPPEITTGGYGDRNVSDERYFALCALWAATGDNSLLEKAVRIRTLQKQRPLDPATPWDRGWTESFGWGMVSGYGTEILLENSERIKDFTLLNSIRSDVLKGADEIMGIVNQSAFKTCLQHFGWGSNGAVCDQAHLLMLAYSINGKPEYKAAAKYQLDYILGANPLNICYVTGCGSKSPLHPHHRPSGASGIVTAGMLSGGPSEWLQDECAKQNLQGQPPLKCFIDAQPSYSTNEVAIYWNSTFVYLLAKTADF